MVEMYGNTILNSLTFPHLKRIPPTASHHFRRTSHNAGADLAFEDVLIDPVSGSGQLP